MLNIGNLGLGAVISAAQETSLPMIIYAVVLGSTELFKLLRTRYQSKKCEKCSEK